VKRFFILRGVEEIFGYIEEVLFASDDFSVAKLKEPRKQDLTYIVGPIGTLQSGEIVRCMGHWKCHARYGRQFMVERFEAKEPFDIVGIQKYLESGVIKGIGPVYAEKIVQRFGIETLHIIDKEPQRLAEISGIGAKRLDLILSCWQQQKVAREAMVFLQSHGITPAYAQKIYKVYGLESIAKVKEDPFALARKIGGIGFKMADQIAQKIGIPASSATRIRAGIDHVLWELSNEGHTCYPEEELIALSAEVIQLPTEMVAIELQRGVEEENFISKNIEDKRWIWHRPFYYAEIGISKEIQRLQRSLSNLRKVQTNKAVLWAEERLGLHFASEQKQAILHAIDEKMQIITGGPGTGKSTITRAILAISEKLTPHILLAAPTGRAAKRMTEITHRKAATIHSLLEVNFKEGGFKKNRENPLEVDLLIIDEASMIDTFLFYQLLKAIPSSARLILIGDIDQLPSVGAGNVLRDLIFSEVVRVTRLTQIYRQASYSSIVTNAHLINRGQFPQLSDGMDFKFIEQETQEGILSALLDLMKNTLKAKYSLDPLEEVQILSPMKRGGIGTENLNQLLQQHFCRNKEIVLSRMGRSFYLGDKVMQTRNDYESGVFNGDTGTIVSIDFHEERMRVNFEDRYVYYPFTKMEDLVLAYAISIHKYQGSESPCVIIPIHMSHFKMLHRNLLYTGITRGKKLVILIGEKRAVGIAVSNDEMKKRYTHLEAILRRGFTPPSYHAPI